ncbi:hypothetical protein N7G274_002458 [Stereocaulon virgatum]|uniref:Uncharacterized protein n=1 Tax=Stereocaulon virgatum TaxID=373712 RepID=A0ABR4AFU7_9LECA
MLDLLSVVSSAYFLLAVALALPAHQTINISPHPIVSSALTSSLGPANASTSIPLIHQLGRNPQPPMCSPFPGSRSRPRTIRSPPDCDFAILRVLWDIPASLVDHPFSWVNADYTWTEGSCEVHLTPLPLYLEDTFSYEDIVDGAKRVRDVCVQAEHRYEGGYIGVGHNGIVAEQKYMVGLYAV